MVVLDFRMLKVFDRICDIWRTTMRITHKSTSDKVLLVYLSRSQSGAMPLQLRV